MEKVSETRVHTYAQQLARRSLARDMSGIYQILRAEIYVICSRDDEDDDDDYTTTRVCVYYMGLLCNAGGERFL